MEELRKKEPYGYLQADTSQSSSYESQIPCDGTNKTRHIPHLPATCTSYNKKPVPMNDEKVVTINFLKESSTHPGPVSVAERIAIENGDLVDSKHKRHSRRMFDFLLPADDYIDWEDAEKSEKEIVAKSSSVNMFPNSTQAADQENDVKLALGTSEGLSYGEDSWKSDSCTQNGVRGLADLNEPVKENFSERAAGSVSYNFLNQRTSLEENHGHHLPSPQSSFFRASRNEQGTSPDLLIADKKEIVQERQFFNNEGGRNTTTMALFSTASSRKNFSISSEAPQPKFKKPVEILSPNQNKRGIPRQNQGQGMKISGRRTPYEQSTAPSVPSPFSVGHIPLAGQSLQCFDGAAARNHSHPSEYLQRNDDLKSHPILGADPSSYRNSFNNGSSQMDYSRAPQSKLPQMIFSNQNLDSILDNNTGRHGPTSSSGLRNNPACLSSHMELDFSRVYPHLKPSGGEMYQGTESTQETEKSRKRKKDLSNVPSNKRLFGISILDGTRQSPALSAPRQEEQPVTGITKCSKKDEKKKKNATSSKARKSNSRGLTNRINLNSDPSSEALAKEAAENIVWMFSSKEQRHLDDISSDPLTDGPLSTTLHWFAEVVSADAASPDDDELDVFEQMTLNLEETKPEDYLRTPWKLEDRKEEEEDDADRKGNAASLLFKKHRRGQGKKRRQRRDFQRDILPGLASLSSREVTEDIHTFSGLMKASGQSWQSGVKKKKKMMKTNNVTTTNSRARGRRQHPGSPPRPPAVPVAAAEKTKNNNTDAEVEGGNIKEWSRTTRRCRKQRCPPATNVPASMA